MANMDKAEEQAKKRPGRTKTEEKVVADAIKDQPSLFPNLVNGLGPEALQDIAEEVIDGYERDLSSRRQWEKRVSNWIKLFSLYMDPKTYPWENCSNVALPLIATACIQFHARSFDGLLPSKNIVMGMPLGKELEDVAASNRVSRHMNYQLMFKMSEFFDSMDVTLLQLPLVGSVIRKTYFDTLMNRPVSDYISPMDIVVNYNTKRLNDNTRITQKIRMNVNDVLKRVESGLYENVDEIDFMDTADCDPNGDVITEQIDKAHGLEKEKNEPDSGVNERLMLEQHVLLALGKDKIKRPYIAVVDYLTRKVLRIVDRRNPFTGEVMNYFTRYLFMPDPMGKFYGIGFGMFLDRVNEAVNSLVNQLIDAGTLSNTNAGFVLKHSGMKRGSLSFSQGEYKEIDIRTDDIRKILFPVDFKPPSSVLFNLLGLLQDYANRLTTVSEFMTGELPRSDTPATAIAAMMEQGMKVFSAIHRRIHRSFQDELQKLYQLNGLYLDPAEYFSLVVNQDDIRKFGAEPVMQQFQVSLQDYRRPMDIIPVSDPNIVSKVERITKAQQAYELVMSNPVTQQNPEAIKMALMDYLKALEVNDSKIEAYLAPPPEQEPPDLSQGEEINAYFSEQEVNALPQQDHMEHLTIIAEFEQSNLYQEMPPRGKRLLDQNKNQHFGFLAQMEIEAKQKLVNQQLAVEMYSQMREGGE